LTGNFNLHSIWVRHGVRLFAQIQQRACYTAGNIKKREITHLSRCIAKSLSDLFADGKKKGGMLVAEVNKFCVAYFANFALCLSANPRAAMFLVKQSHLAKKIARIEVSKNNFFAVAVVFNHYCDRAFNNVVKGVPLITCVNNGAFRGVAPTVTVR